MDSLIKDKSSQPQVFYRMTSFITFLIAGNDVYLICCKYRSLGRCLFFFSPCHIWLHATFLTAQFCPVPKQRRSSIGPTSPEPTPDPVPLAAPQRDLASKPAVASGSKELGLSLPPLLHSLGVTATSCSISKCGLGALRGIAFHLSVQHPAKQVRIPEQKR